ncbi:MAG: ATP-binding protein [Alkalilacustris sp.]
MTPRRLAPRRLSGLLVLLGASAAIAFIATMTWVATTLAASFDDNARQDAMQRVDRGIETMTRVLANSALDYSLWTEHYEATQNRDISWLNENVGSGVTSGDFARLMILGGGPLESTLVWSDQADGAPAPDETDRALRDARALLATEETGPQDGPTVGLHWIDQDLWLLALAPVRPHTYDPDPDRPMAVLVMAAPVSDLIERLLGGTLLLRDVRLQTVPGPDGASRLLGVVDGPPAWIAWSLPDPGSRAIRAVLPPAATALAVLLLVLGAGLVFVHRLAVDLERARLAAEAASASKSDFLARMSHEIRTPLNGVIGMADLLADTPLEARQHEMLQTIRQSGDTLLGLINDILDLSRVEAGKLTLDAAPFRLETIIARIESLHGALARARGVTFEVRCGADPTQVFIGDEARILQILHNLVGNAVKFTETGTIVLDIAHEASGAVVLCVRDTGIGMTADQLSRLFVAFEQADTSIARRYGGSGLGMSIVRRLVDLMGGRVSATSTPGQGTAITVRLPLARADTVAPAALEAPEDPCTTAAQLGRLRGGRLLVAEDNATNRRILELMLHRLRMEPAFARDGDEACALWQTTAFDLVLMDISMPTTDGLAALRAMQRHSLDTGRPPPRAIAVTANVMREQIDRYLSAGFVDVLAKPIQQAALHDVLLRQWPTGPAPGGPGPALASTAPEPGTRS